MATSHIISTIGTKLEFDTGNGLYNSSIQIDSNHFINFFAGTDSDGFVQVFEVNTTTWAVTTAAASLEFDTVNGTYNSCCQIDSNHFVNFWTGPDSDGYVQIFEVNTTTWAVTTAAASLEFDTVQCADNCTIQIDSNHFINFWAGSGSDGYVQIFEVNTTTWAVTTAAASLEFDTDHGKYNAAAKIDSTHFINIWGNSSSIGHAQVFTVNTSTWAVTTAAAKIDISVGYNLYNTITGVDSNHFIIFYDDTTYDGVTQILTVNTSTWEITTSDILIIDTAGFSHANTTKIDSTHFLTLWHGGVNGDGFGQIFTVDTSTWGITKTILPVAFDTSQGYSNNVKLIDSTHVINFWGGESNDGYVQVFGISDITYQGPNYPGTTENRTSVGTVAWSNTDNIKVDDSSYATASILSNQTNWIIGKNFGFSIPTNSLITGISVSINGYTSVAGWGLDYVRIVCNDEVLTTNKLAPFTSTTPDNEYTSPNFYLWDNIFTPAKINSSTFGVAISTYASTTPADIYINCVNIVVTYQELGYEPILEVNVSDNISITESTTIPTGPLGIFINSYERTKYVEVDSLMIESVLTSQVDTCSFIINKISGSTTLNYKPVVGNEVVISYLYGTIFAGIITKITQQMNSYGIVQYAVECCDYTRFLDRKLVADTFTNKTVNEIISTINSTYLTGFTLNNVSCAETIDYIKFNYISVSAVLTKLADLTQHDWYVDYEKDIHFFARNSQSAPFDLEDDTNTYINSSLQLKNDTSQLRNVIYVRGGEYLGETFTTEILCDGTTSIYDLPYKYSGLTVTTSAETPPGQSLNIGLDDINNPDDYDLLWNFQEKIIKFRDSRIPSNGNILRVGGKPYLPVRVKTSNRASINEMKTLEGGSGEYEFIVIDESIKTKLAALERADAELKSYQNTLTEGEFQTYQNGLKPGQRIKINSVMHEVNEYYLINKIITRVFSGNTMIYNVSLVSTKTYGIVEFLRDLLLKENQSLVTNESSTETVDIIESIDESTTSTDTISSTFTSHNPQIETITNNEVKTEHALDWGITFVAGEYIPTDVSTDTKRVFNTNGSRLG